MIKIKTNAGHKTKEVSSEDIRVFLSKRDDFDDVRDISGFVNESNVMAFDCKLDDDILSLEDINEAIAEMENSENIQTGHLWVDASNVNSKEVQDLLVD